MKVRDKFGIRPQHAVAVAVAVRGHAIDCDCAGVCASVAERRGAEGK